MPWMSSLVVLLPWTANVSQPQQQSTFEKMTDKFGFRASSKMMVKFILLAVAPKIADYLEIELFDAESQNYFAGVVKNAIKFRRGSGERREDFLQLMMDAQAEENSKATFDGDLQIKERFTDEDIIAHGLMFLMAGLDPVQSVLILTLYALALEPEVQERLHKEVTSVVDKYGGKLTYEGILEMTYLDMVINESMRRYPPTTRTERVCSKTYCVPGTNFVIEKGTIIMIPILGIHKNPKYFPNPEKFIPERFTPENKAGRHPYSFLPFGHGPRNCIGMRFGLVKVKTVIAQLIKSFQFAPCQKTQIPLEFDRHVNVKPKDAMWLNVTVRD